jgi:redox-sensitive bicupin YhaK (pirin superfamily)
MDDGRIGRSVTKSLHGGTTRVVAVEFEMLQLWVNLPAESKMTQPNYQTLLARDIQTVALPDGVRSCA